MDIHSLIRLAALVILGVVPLYQACTLSEEMPQQPGQLEISGPSTPPGAVTSIKSRGEISDGVPPPLIIGNTFLPLAPKKGDTLIIRAAAAEHPAGPVELRYQWAINDLVVSGAHGPTLQVPLAKGDKVSVTVIPEVGGLQGLPLTQTTVIGNSPPVVQNTFNDPLVSKNHFTARIKADDPDGDPLSFRLLKGPKNLVIDEQTGEVSWNFQPTDAGTHELSISVKDSDNTEVILNIPLKLESGVKPAASNDHS